MGREVKRVPVGFNWPVGEIWFGYLLDAIDCELCKGTGKGPEGGVTNGFEMHDGEWHTYESEYCPACDGEGNAYPKLDVPAGPGYQVWETTSEGSPISPTFESPEELARWLADNNASSFGRQTATYEQWFEFIVGPGWAPSAVMTPETGIISGVEAVSK